MSPAGSDERQSGKKSFENDDRAKELAFDSEKRLIAGDDD